MRDLNNWLERQARRDARAVYLADALLAHRFWAYAQYRLRYFFLRYLAASLLHAVKFLFIYHAFSRNTFVALVIAHLAVSFVSSFWWGALEVMRRRIRDLYRTGRRRAIPAEIGAWLSLSVVLALGSIVVAGLWIAWSAGYVRRPFTAAYLYGLALFLRIALDFVARTFHSGIYALRRVYRPLPSIIGVELLSFGAPLALWPLLGVWSLPIAAIVANLVTAGLVVFYAIRTYRYLNLLPDTVNARSIVRPSLESAGEFFGAGMSYALMKMDAFLVLMLSAGAASPDDGIELFVLFFAISPTIQAGFDWAQLFYFDLKRLEGTVLAALRDRYERGVFGLAWAAGGLCWCIGTLAGTLVMWRSLGDLYWLMGPFLVSRSLLAFYQVRAFSARRYLQLLGSAVLWLLGFLTVTVSTSNDRVRLIALFLVTVVSLMVLARRSKDPAGGSGGQEPVGLAEWFAQIRSVDEPVRIRCAELVESVAAPLGNGPAPRPATRRLRLQRMAERIARRGRSHGSVAVIYPDRVIWYETKRRVPIRDEWILRSGAGFVKAIANNRWEQNGIAALKAAQARRLLGKSIGGCLGRRDAVPSPAEMESAFAAIRPYGLSYSPGEPVPALVEALSSKDRQAIFSDAIHFARHCRSGRASRFDVTAAVVNGELRSIFVLDRRAARRLRVRWRDLVICSNLLGTSRAFWSGLDLTPSPEPHRHTHLDERLRGSRPDARFRPDHADRLGQV